MNDDICAQLASCVRELRNQKTYVKSPKRHEKAKIETRLTNYPCRTESKCDKCIQFLDVRSRPSCTEHGKSYTLEKSREMEVLGVHIDGGVIDSNATKKCDYMFVLRRTEQQKILLDRVILIELKGGGVNDALEQLTVTLALPCMEELLRSDCGIYGRISTTGSVPNLRSSDPRSVTLQRELMRQFRKLHGNLKIERTPFEERYDEMDQYL